MGGQDDQTAQRSRLESGTKKLPVPFRQCLARIYYVCICFISPPTSRLLTLNAGYVCKQPEKCQFQAYSSAPFICQLCLTFQKQATAEIISCPFQHQLKLNDVKYGKLHRRKFRRNYQVPYSLLMGLNCALGSNRRLRGAAKSWKKLLLRYLLYPRLLTCLLLFFCCPAVQHSMVKQWRLPIINISKVTRVCI